MFFWAERKLLEGEQMQLQQRPQLHDMGGGSIKQATALPVAYTPCWHRRLVPASAGRQSVASQWSPRLS